MSPESMRSRARPLRSIAALAVAALISLSSCAGEAGTSDSSLPAEPDASTSTAGQPDSGEETGGTLIFARTSDINSFDPSQLPIANFFMIPQLFNKPVSLDENLEPQPELAESWEYNDDQTELTLHLRDDVVFHDGTSFTAETLVWNLERYLDEETGANAQSLLTPITSYEAIDDHTVVLRFDEPFAAVFDGLDLLYITAPADDEAIRSTPNGTGPFVLADRVPGSSITLERNPNYWRDGLPLLDTIEMRVLPDFLAASAALEAGEVDVLMEPTAEVQANLAGNDAIEIVSSTSPSVVRAVTINMTRAPFGEDSRLRQAVSAAIDRQRIVDVVYGGNSEAWCLPWAENSIAFTPRARDCPQDLARSEALLEEAGYGEGELEVTVITNDADVNVAIIQIVAANLEEAGIVVNLERLDLATQRERLLDLDFEIAMDGYGRANRDPVTLLLATNAFRPGGKSGFDSEEYQELLHALATTIDPAARQDILADLDALFLEEEFIVSLAAEFSPYAISTEVEGMGINLDGMPILETASVSGS